MNKSKFNSLFLLWIVILVEITFASSDDRFSGNGTTQSCSSSQFACASGECIEKSKVCDGEKNCEDNSDENYTTCNKELETCRRSTPLCQNTPAMWTTSPTPNANSTITVNGICDLPLCSDHTFTVTDGDDNFMNVSSHSKVPKFSQIKITCNEGLSLSNGDQSQESTCYQKQKWNPPLKPCLHDCGVPNSAQPKIVKKVVSDSPWNVAIYQTFPDPELLCSGTLVSVRIVLTAATCFIRDNMHYARNLSTTNYEIIVSKFTIDHEKIDSAFQKSYEIRDIIFTDNPGYDPIFDQENIAALVLRNAVERNRFVLPACIDWSSGTDGFQAAEGTLGAYFMFGDETQDLDLFGSATGATYKQVQNGTLLRADLPFRSHGRCLEKDGDMNTDRFCADTSRLPKHMLEGVGFFFRDPSNGRYFLRGISGHIFNSSMLYHYQNVTTFVDVSKYLKWLQEVHDRVKQESGTIENSRPSSILCPLLQPRNVDMTCHRGERKVKCKTELVPGTRVKAQCKSFYSGENGIHYQEVVCQEDGTWDHTLLTCVPDGCGVPNPAQPELVNEVASNSPWNVAIYGISDGPHLICAGTLISPNIVVSAGHCFYDNICKRFLNLSSDYEVVVGKYTGEYKTIDSSFQKNYQVQDIIIHDDFQPKFNTERNDICALVLKKSVDMNQFVLPACIDWSSSIYGFYFSDGLSGKIAGWNISDSSFMNQTQELITLGNRTLFSIELPFMNYTYCYKNGITLVRYFDDRFCVDYVNIERMGVYGTGLVMRDPQNGRYFLRGIGSHDLGFSSTFFIDISKYSDWLEKINARVEREQRIAESCPILKTTNVDLICYNKNNNRVNCNNELVRGSRVQIQCKPFYIEEKPVQYKELICQQNRTWDKDIYKCVPECGTVRDSIPYIFNGTNEPIANSPWHVAVCSVLRQSIICGGTLVTTRMVVSAAHCFFDIKKGIPINNATDYEIIVSKYTRDYYTTDETQVKHKVHKIMVHRSFNSKTAGHYGYDIAVVILEKTVERTIFAIPACVDWEPKRGFKPAEGTLGKLVGWGIVNSTNEGGTASDVLLSAMLPYVSYEKCLGTVTPLPNDQFCAGSKSGTGPGPRQGDSGGGLMFQDPQNGRYYLRGIVSTGKEHSTRGANPQKRAVFVSFTDISQHISWLSEIRVDVSVMFS